MKTIVATMLLTFAFNMTAEASGVGQVFKAGARKNVQLSLRSSQSIKGHITEGLKKTAALPNAKHTVINNSYDASQNTINATVERVIMKDGSERQALIVRTSEFYTPKSAKDAKRAGTKEDILNSFDHLVEVLPAESDINELLLKPFVRDGVRFERSPISKDHNVVHTLVIDLLAKEKGVKLTSDEIERRINAVSEILAGMGAKLEGRESKIILSRASNAVKARTEK